MKIKTIIFLLILPAFLFGQTGVEKLVHGKIQADSTSLEGINVFNLVTEKSTKTDKNGVFFILAKANDLLVITAVNLEIKRKLIEEDDLKLKIIYIKMILQDLVEIKFVQ